MKESVLSVSFSYLGPNGRAERVRKSYPCYCTASGYNNLLALMQEEEQTRGDPSFQYLEQHSSSCQFYFTSVLDFAEDFSRKKNQRVCLFSLPSSFSKIQIGLCVQHDVCVSAYPAPLLPIQCLN
jgi:hypothetical protein